jgi:urea transporter
MEEFATEEECAPLVIELLRGIGAPADDSRLGLATVDKALCGLSESMSDYNLNEISPYAAFGNVSPGSTLKAVRQQGQMVFRETASLVRRALFTVHFMARQDLLPESDVEFICNLKERLAGGRPVKTVRYYANLARPFLFGTASGLNAEVRLRLDRFPLLRDLCIFILNDVLRGYGSMYWCCNPWTGLLLFIALLLESRYDSLCCLFAVLMCNLFGRIIGAPLILLELGLLQFKAMALAQIIAHRHMDAQAMLKAGGPWEAIVVFKTLLMIFVCTWFMLICALGVNAFLIPSTKVCDYGLVYITLGIWAVLASGAQSTVFSLNFDKGLPFQMDPTAHPAVDAMAYDISHIDWRLVAHTIFGAAGQCVWLSSTTSNILIWVGLYICSPLNAIFYFVSARWPR